MIKKSIFASLTILCFALLSFTDPGDPKNPVQNAELTRGQAIVEFDQLGIDQIVRNGFSPIEEMQPGLGIFHPIPYLPLPQPPDTTIICDGMTMSELRMDIEQRTQVFMNSSQADAAQAQANKNCRAVFFIIRNCKITRVITIEPQFPCWSYSLQLQLTEGPRVSATIIN